MKNTSAGANATSFKGDASKMYTIGGSAGGGLALQIAYQVLKDPTLKPSLKGIAAQVPCTSKSFIITLKLEQTLITRIGHWDSIPEKYASKYTAYKDNEKDVPVIDKESMEIFYKHVGADPHDKEVFTILATDKHAEFPPTYFTSAEFDPLRDDAFVMEAALKEAGVPTKHDHYPGMPHYF